MTLIGSPTLFDKEPEKQLDNMLCCLRKSIRSITVKSKHDQAVHGMFFPNHVTRSLKPFIRSEEHTSELQSRFDLVCRLLLEKKKKHTFCTMSKITDS